MGRGKTCNIIPVIVSVDCAAEKNVKDDLNNSADQIITLLLMKMLLILPTNGTGSHVAAFRFSWYILK